MRLPEEMKLVPVMNTADYNSGVVADSINMKNFHRATFIMTFGAITGDAVLTINSGATDAAKTSALTFTYAQGSADIGAASCDVLATNATSAALTLTAATYNSTMMICEVDASAMDIANSEEWLTLDISNAASAGICHIVAVLEPRYKSGQSATALA